MNKSIFIIALAAAALSTPLLAQAQETPTATTLQQILSDKNLPLKMQMKDLTLEYRRLVVGGSANDWMSAKMRIFGQAAGLETDVYFTNGQTVNIAGESYLVAYAPDVPIDIQKLQNWDGHGPRPKAPKPTPDTPLTLSLLHLRTAGSLNDVRPFDRNLDMETPEQTYAASVKTLQQLGEGMNRYLRAKGNLIPEFENPIDDDMAQWVYPLVGDRRLFRHPTNEMPYVFNSILAGKKVQHVGSRQSMVFFYENEPARDGRRAVLFLDGHVERVTPEHWERLKKASKIEENEDGRG